MKAIDEFETMLKDCLEAHREDNPNKEVCTVLSTIISYDLEQLKTELKEQYRGDVVFLQWIYDRMECVHDENKNHDYMIKFKKIIYNENH
jgi:hypothetical protein